MATISFFIFILEILCIEVFIASLISSNVSPLITISITQFTLAGRVLFVILFSVGQKASLVDAIKAEGIEQDFSFIERQKGMFSFLGISAEQVDQLVNKHSVYLVSSSRINLAGLNQHNIAYVAKSIAAVL